MKLEQSFELKNPGIGIVYVKSIHVRNPVIFVQIIPPIFVVAKHGFFFRLNEISA
jgi:hypothetical protein